MRTSLKGATILALCVAVAAACSMEVFAPHAGGALASLSFLAFHAVP
jgi:hypothetical protein